MTSAKTDSLHSRRGCRPRRCISLGKRDERQLTPVEQVLDSLANQKYVSMIRQDGTKLLGDSPKALKRNSFPSTARSRSV